MSLKIIPAHSRREKSDFIDFPYRLHRGQPAWVPPLISEIKTTLNPSKNPFFEHATVQQFLAQDGKRTVGRIAAIIDDNYIKIQNEMVGLFGFFDSINDQEVAAALFNTVSQWLRQANMKKMLGPTNPSLNDELGVLIDAFDLPPAIKMVWNPPYYPDLYDQCGFDKAMDLIAWIGSPSIASERMIRLGELIIKRTKLTFRPLDMKHFDHEIKILRNIYNQAWSENWGFVPWTEAEFEHLAKSLKQIIDIDMVFIAELNSQPVGFLLALPDINIALKHIAGHLFPFGLPKLLWFSRKIDRVRIAILGVLKEFRNRGIDTAMYYEIYRRLSAHKRYDSCEASWVLEDNDPMVKMLSMTGAHPYKTYRLYERAL